MDMDTGCPAPTCTPSSVFTALIMASLNFSDYRSLEEARTSAALGPGEEFDFIVVGGGSGGCVVASRLSEVRRWRVLLLEAGPEEPQLTEVPALNRFFWLTGVDWDFATQPSGWDRGQRVPRGRVLGGSSAINGLLYSRGNREDYDGWALQGNKGWSYEDVLPFFKKSEKNLNEDVAKDYRYHSDHGMLHVQRYPYRDENVPVILNAMEEIGLPFNKDHTGASQVGATLLQFTSDDGRRYSSNRAFIFPVRRRRRNLVVETRAVVRLTYRSNEEACLAGYRTPDS